MKKTLAVVAASVLAFSLAACSNDTIPPAETVTTYPTATTNAQRTGDLKGTIGEPVNIATLEGNEVNLTITEMTLGDACRYGINDYGITDPDYGVVPDGKQLLQVWAEVDAVNVLTHVGNDWIMLHDPEIVDEQGYTQSVEGQIFCRGSDEGHEIWSTTINSGEKKRYYAAFLISSGTKEIKIMNVTFDAPEEAPDNATVERHTPSPTLPAAPAAPAAPAEPAPVVGFTGAPGHDQPRVLDKTIASCGDPTLHQTGTTFFTEGTSGWTEQCQNQMTQ